MGVLANHVPSIEQLKPGLVEIVEESGPTKQYFCTYQIHSVSIRNQRRAIDDGHADHI
jgi:F0F1-type ATP synthase epsilon subunit